MNTKEIKEVIKASSPIALSFIPIGLACGMILLEAGFSPLFVFLMSTFVFAGASQFMVASMTIMGTSLFSLIIMTFFLNLRHILMSISISPYLRNASKRYLLLFSHFLTDESYAVNITQFYNSKSMGRNNWSLSQALLSNVFQFLAWVISSTIGALLGSSLNIDTTITSYMLVAMFIYLLVLSLSSKIHVFTSLVSGLLVVILFSVLKHNIALVISALLASFIGFAVDNYFSPNDDNEEESI